MKKFFMMAIAVVSIALMSCGSGVEAKAVDYAKQSIEAMKSGDYSKVIEISKEAEKYASSLSDEDKKIFLEAMQKYTEEHKAEVEDALKNGIGNAIKGLGF